MKTDYFNRASINLAPQGKPTRRRGVLSKLATVLKLSKNPQDEPIVLEPEPVVNSNNTRVSFAEIHFANGACVKLERSDIVAIVGPNNAGKSAILRELAARFESQRSVSSTVLKEVRVWKDGTAEDFRSALRAKSHIEMRSGKSTYIGYRYSVEEENINHIWDKSAFQLANIFCRFCSTEGRITDSDPARAFDALRRPPDNPIHNLYTDENIEKKISKYFYQAFGQELIVDRLGGEKIALLVGKRPNVNPPEDRLSVSYNKRLRTETIPLVTQGDGMRSFASVVLSILTEDSSNILLIDEPEAFLHPPQARLLGEIIAKERPANAQVFIATHSADVLGGLLSVEEARLRIVRIERDGGDSKIKELEPEKAKSIAKDPLLKYSSTLNGIFHQRVIVAEADTDCLFYQAILSIPEVHGELEPDVLFIHANGKHRAAILAESLRSLGVEVDVIVDIDILNDQQAFERLLTALGGDWKAVASHWKTVKSAVEQKRPSLSAIDAKIRIEQILTGVSGAAEFPRQAKSDIEVVLKQLSPWDAVKAAGDAAIPSGDATQSLNTIRAQCEQRGIWIVPVGELERFCRSIGGHGPKWVQQVITNRNLAIDPELSEARTFIKQVWGREKMRSVPEPLS
ncbi:ATP-dependent endonuclease [Mesorhizobium sp. INR15]|uniref:ATP-dependent nuclease n=1 Tax=Mesorhizobium sp. INR15 TaxID=2654248 RepID=UPI00189644EF|nr:ATP-binding protein [Mesorhizobium sp. INR15]